MSEPLVSVIIVNHNGIEFIQDVLSSVFSSSYKNFEVIFVDNASVDGSLELAKQKFSHNPKLRIVENQGSLGPAVGRNNGAKVAEGKYLIFLDNDTKVDMNLIAELVNILENDNYIGLAQAKLLRMNTDNYYDCAGDYLGPFGFLIERSRQAKDSGQFDFITDILSAKSAASIIRRNVFDKISGFDEDYYMYLEETDLSWRVWLLGYRVVFIPQAIAYHAFNTPRKDFKRYYPKYIVRYYGCRNYILTLLKNLELVTLLKILPLHLGCWVLLSIFFALKFNIDDAFYILKGISWNILNIPLILRKRHFINTHIRSVSDSKILKKIMDKRKIDYYLGKGFAYLTGKAF